MAQSFSLPDLPTNDLSEATLLNPAWIKFDPSQHAFLPTTSSPDHPTLVMAHNVALISDKTKPSTLIWKKIHLLSILAVPTSRYAKNLPNAPFSFHPLSLHDHRQFLANDKLHHTAPPSTMLRFLLFYVTAIIAAIIVSPFYIPSSELIMTDKNYVYTPFENGSFLPSTTFPSSPFNTPSPESTIVVVGGGLAGLSTAIELVDQVYEDAESVFKLFADNLVARDHRGILDELRQLDVTIIKQLIEQNPRHFNTLLRLSDFKVYILDKEEKLGGNSMKASSGINAVGTRQQDEWFTFQKSANPADALKHPNLYTDSVESFIFDTTKSSVSPEPPIWEPLHSGLTHGRKTDPTDDLRSQINHLLSPLSPYTPSLINQVIKDSKRAIPFLESRQILEFVETLLTILYDHYYPAQPQLSRPVSHSKRHTNSPPRPFELFLSKLAQLGGHQHPRTHRPGANKVGQKMTAPELPIGAASISSLSNRLLTFPYNTHIQIINSVKFTGLTFAEAKSSQRAEKATQNTENIENAHKPAKINGVIYSVLESYDNTHNQQYHNLPAHVGQNFVLKAANVVLSTGGYSASTQLLTKYAPNIANMGLPTTNGPWATGDAITVALDAGAAVVGMDMIQIHPTSFVVPTNPHNKVNFLAPEAMRGVGGILVNLKGQRFINELTTRDVAARSIYWQPRHISYLILPQEVGAEFGGAINFYASKNIIAKTTQFNEEDKDKWTDTITSRLHTILGPSFTDGAELIKVVDQLIKTEGTELQANSPKVTLFGTQTTSTALQIIDTTITMLKLTTTLNQQNVYSYQDDFLPLMKNTFTTMTTYSTYLDTQDDPFRRSYINKPTTFNFNSQFYFIAIITPAIHFTMGGIAINTDGEVLQDGYFAHIKQTWTESITSAQVAKVASQKDLSTPNLTTSLIHQFVNQPQCAQVDAIEKQTPHEQRVIQGLYAVGEASGGLHGRNRLGGNSLLECVTMGRQVAGVIFGKLVHNNDD